MTISKTKRARTLLKTQEEIESILITAIKDHKKGDEAKIVDLESCVEGMLKMTFLMGRGISPQERTICMNIAEDAKHIVDSAEHCMIAMRSEKERRQLTINSLSNGDLEYNRLKTFSGDVFPQHFYQWRRDALNLRNLGISLANHGSYIMTFLEGEAKSRVEEKLASVCSPTKEQVVEVLRCFYGNPSKIIQHLIDTHKSLGKIPSHEEGWINMYPIVSNHYKVIVSMREIGAEVGENIHTDSDAWGDASLL